MDKENSPVSILYPIALLLMSLSLGLHSIDDYDIWWHLKTGEVILWLKSIPRYDMFSYSAFGAPWTNHEWLSEIILWLTYKFTNFGGLSILVGILTTGIAFFIYRSARLLTNSKNLALWTTLIVLCSFADRLMIRPFMFTFLFLSVEIYILHLFTQRKKNILWSIPILQVAWVNLHGGGILGPIIIIAYLFGERLQLLLKAQNPPTIKEIKILALTALFTLGACLVTPDPFSAFSFPFEHLQMHNIVHFTSEWIPGLHPALNHLTSVWAFRILMTALLVSFVLNSKMARFSHLIIALMLALLAVQSKRFGPKFVIFSVPIIFLNFRTAFKSMRPNLSISDAKVRLLNILNLGAIIGICIIIINFGFPLGIKGNGLQKMEFGVGDKAAPEGMIKFLEDNNIRGRGFNQMCLGGYLTFRRWPKERVFIDGRTPVFGDDFYYKFVNAIEEKGVFKNYDSQYNFDYILLRGNVATDSKTGIMQYLDNNSREWALVYGNPLEAVFLRRIPKWAKIIKKHEIKCPGPKI